MANETTITSNPEYQQAYDERKTTIEGKAFTRWFQRLLLTSKTSLERKTLRDSCDEMWLVYRENIEEEKRKEAAQ